jgi:hypothetical protein
MAGVSDWYAAQEADFWANIARQKRLLDLAIQNGWRCEVSQLDHLEGEWWRVPPMWEPIVGCQLARVA